IQEAGERLRVSHMTVRRWMERLHFREWTEEAWKEIIPKVMGKQQWQAVIQRLRESGLSTEAARKRGQRWKRSGLALDEALQRASSPRANRGTCAAGKEERAVGGMHRGKFYCADCLAEKIGKTGPQACE